MKNTYSDDGVRKRLIICALDELCRHGTEDFSLRRVAIGAEVSCAAPYRHFKSKEELIVETAKYITSKWTLLADEIVAVHGADPERTLSELASAAVKFWIANGKFRSLLMPDRTSLLAEEMKSFDIPLREVAEKYFDKIKLPEEQREQAVSKILAVIYGSVLLYTTGKLSSRDAADTVCREILKINNISENV